MLDSGQQTPKKPTKKQYRLMYLPAAIGVVFAAVFWMWDVAPQRTAAQLAWWAFVPLVIATLLLVVLHLVDKELNPMNTFVSDYARSPKLGYLMNTSFVCSGSSAIVLSIAVVKVLGAPMVGWALSLGGVCLALSSVFITRSAIHVVEGVKEGLLHDLFIVISFALFVLSMFLCAVAPLPGMTVTWFPAVAWSQFNFSLIALLAQGIVMISHWHHRASSDASIPGKGLSERAVIFLMIEWDAILCWICFVSH